MPSYLTRHLFSKTAGRSRVKQAACILTLALLLGTAACSKEAKTPVESADPISPSEQVTPEDEAAKRAAWEAQLQLTRDVLQSTGRDELIGSAYTKGPRDAEVVLIEFSDFECPYCAAAAVTVKDFSADRESDVLVIYKNFPLTTIHPEAMPAAKAAWAAGKQDQFWLYHDGLFAFQDKLGEDYYVELAEQIGLDMEQFERDRNSPEAQAAIDQDIKLAEALKVQGTPTFFLNEYQLPGNAPKELFDQAVTELKAEIQQSKAK